MLQRGSTNSSHFSRFLVVNRSEKEWIIPPRGWGMAKAQFAILLGERFTSAVA